MTYLDYIVLFQKRDLEQSFSGNTTRLYIKLLYLANALGWPAEFVKPDTYVAAVCGFSLNTMKECRAQLVARGLLAGNWGTAGRNAAGAYRLLTTAGNVSEYDTLPAVIISDSDTISSLNLSKSDTISPENELNVSDNVSNFDTLNIDREKEESSTASAATHPPYFSAEKSEKPKPAASRKKLAAHADEVAALELPHSGSKFAQLWADFLTSPKQTKKPLTALKLILAKLGEYAEGFACLMLEDAIQGDWSGVVFDSTAEKYTKWRAAEAERARRQPVRTSSPTRDGPEPNQVFLDEVAARKQKEEDAHFARYQVQPEPSVVVDPNKEFGYTQSAEEGLAQARATPEYQQYQAELAAARERAAPETQPKPPDSPSENSSDSTQQAA